MHAWQKDKEKVLEGTTDPLVVPAVYNVDSSPRDSVIGNGVEGEMLLAQLLLAQLGDGDDEGGEGERDEDYL